MANRNWVGTQAEWTQEKHQIVRISLNRTSTVFGFQSGPGCTQNRFRVYGQMQHLGIESSRVQADTIF